MFVSSYLAAPLNLRVDGCNLCRPTAQREVSLSRLIRSVVARFLGIILSLEVNAASFCNLKITRKINLA